MTPIRAVHITQLRTALDGVYVAQKRPLPTYPPITAGQTVITTDNITTLRSAIRVVE